VPTVSASWDLSLTAISFKLCLVCASFLHIFMVDSKHDTAQLKPFSPPLSVCQLACLRSTPWCLVCSDRKLVVEQVMPHYVSSFRLCTASSGSSAEPLITMMTTCSTPVVQNDVEHRGDSIRLLNQSLRPPNLTLHQHQRFTSKKT
jgi:hypothetical protein